MSKNTLSTLIEYVILSEGSPLESVYIPPAVFHNNIVDFLKVLPKDILQLIDAKNYYEYQLRSSSNQGYDLKVIKTKDWNRYLNFSKNIPRIRLFFFDGESKKQLEILKELLMINENLSFYCFYKRNTTIIDLNIVSSPFDFIEKLKSSEDLILQSLNAEHKSFNFSIPLEFGKLLKYDLFSPVRNNVYTINNCIGNYYFSPDFTVEEHAETTSNAIKEGGTFNRQKIFSYQLKNLDALTTIAYKENIVKKVSGIEPEFAPLILIAPFHNPDFKTKEAELSYLLTLEQTTNYTIDCKIEKVTQEKTFFAMRMQKLRLDYLDDMSFLHSSFCFSPSLRLPIRGKSIYRELSFFRAKFFKINSTPHARRKLLKTINSFGKKMALTTINQTLQDELTSRNSQIVAISDLPIEWINLNDIPLSFTHDVCRIPETSLHGIMSHYVTNQNIKFSINKVILQNTLVILGCHDPDFEVWHKELYKLQSILNFHIVSCSTRHEVRNAVEKYRPELLIFDCHGGMDPDTNSTFLWIGNEKFESQYVVDYNITAPLVFLSACGTAPTYGTMNPIANAFFEAGALSVTSTFLPISVDRGSILYLRLLSNLNFASTEVIHKNWLEFVCYVIRTSTISEAYKKALEKNDGIDLSEFHSANTVSLVDSLKFNKRRSLYRSLDQRISQMAKVEREYYTSTIPEYLLYTNLGRGDLVLFDSWINENHIKNMKIP